MIIKVKLYYQKIRGNSQKEGMFQEKGDIDSVVLIFSLN